MAYFAIPLLSVSFLVFWCSAPSAVSAQVCVTDFQLCLYLQRQLISTPQHQLKCVRLVYDAFLKLRLRIVEMVLHEPDMKSHLSPFCIVKKKADWCKIAMTCSLLDFKKNDQGFISQLMQFMSSSLMVLDLLWNDKAASIVSSNPNVQGNI